eukprot:2895841-Pleurochrysis_carterae.AAC.1
MLKQKLEEEHCEKLPNKARKRAMREVETASDAALPGAGQGPAQRSNNNSADSRQPGIMATFDNTKSKAVDSALAEFSMARTSPSMVCAARVHAPAPCTLCEF